MAQQSSITDQPHDLGEPLWCENLWCGLGYDLREGWGGLCPSCVTLVDEHLAGGHGQELVMCVECRRAGIPRRRVRARSA